VGADKVLCVLSTTSCFAPRGVDKLLELSRLCAELDPMGPHPMGPHPTWLLTPHGTLPY